MTLHYVKRMGATVHKGSNAIDGRTTIPSILCICAFPFKARFLFTMRNTVIAIAVSFLICPIMTLPYLMINNVTADIAMSTNNTSIVYSNINNVLSEVFASAYINDYFPCLDFKYCQCVLCCSLWCTAFLLLQGRRHQVLMSESSENTLHRTIVMICVIMMLFISGEFPTTSALALRTYVEHIDNLFAQWLGFSYNGIFVVNAIVYGSYFLNIWVYVVMSKSFHERLLTMLCITSAR